MFNLQSRLIQTEGIIAQLAQAQFDAQMGVAYYNLGKSFTGDDKSRASLNFMSFLEHPGCKPLLQSWALSGLSDLIYGKAAPNGAPLAWVLSEPDMKDMVSTLSPYLSSVPLKEHLGLIHQIVAQAQIDVPKIWVDALTKAKERQAMMTGYLALTFLLDNALLVYDRPKYSRANPQQLVGYETCFITRCRRIIEAMAQANIFAASSDLKSAMIDSQAALAKFNTAIYGAADKPWGAKTLSALKQGTLAVAKLTPKIVDGGKCYYDLTIPQSGLDICNRNARILPVSLIYQFTEGFMYHLVENGYSRITCVSPEAGEYTVDVTINPALYKEAYSNSTDTDRVEARSRLPVGFALRSGAMHLLNIESSLFSSKGYSKVNPWNIVGVKKIALKDVNTVAHDYEPNNIQAVFIKHLKGKTAAELRVIMSKVPELQAKYPEKTPLSITGIVDAVPKVHYSKLLTYLLENVPNAAEELKSVGTRPPMKDYILKGNNDEERAESLKELLKTHVVYISFIAKSGADEVFATNSEAILEEKLGKWYKLEYEGWDIKCAELKRYALENKLQSPSLVEALVRKYKIKYLDTSKLTAVTPEALDKWIEDARASKPKRNYTPDPLMVTIRNLNASSPGDYFKNVKIPSIQAIKIDK